MRCERGVKKPNEANLSQEDMGECGVKKPNEAELSQDDMEEVGDDCGRI